MSTINIINCKIENNTHTSSMFNKSSIAKNIGIFKDLNAIQKSIKKEISC